jgi:hypothetical protein
LQSLAEELQERSLKRAFSQVLGDRDLFTCKQAEAGVVPARCDIAGQPVTEQYIRRSQDVAG